MDKYMKLKDIPKGKRWAHFWEYYKIHTIVTVAVLVLVVMLVKDVFFREKVDIVITESSVKYTTEAASAELKRVLTLHARDFDGNGERVADVYQITMSTDVNEDPQMIIAAQTRLVAQFQDENAIIFLMDEDIYNYLKSDEDPDAMYADLSETVGGSVTPLLGEDKTRLYLKDIPAYQDNELLQQLPDLFFVMRREEHVNRKGDEKIAEIYDRSVQMMENLASGAMQEDPVSAK